ncbi:MAG: hypothetical protein LCH69_02720 [Proteobacteria bacterium]|nr:hypothetical protein [Pseudomonadota bacterium]
MAGPPGGIYATENQIRELHRELLRHSGKYERHRGARKTSASPIAAIDGTGRQIGTFAVVLLEIDPFQDAKGRRS